MNLEALYKDPKSYLIGVILVFAGEKVWGYIEKGVEADFETQVEEIFMAKLKEPTTFDILLNSKEVTKFKEDAGKEVRAEIIEDVMKKDTNKISMRSFLGMKTGLRDEDVLPALAKLLDAWEKGDLMTKEQANNYINHKLSRRVSPRVNH